MVAIVSALTAAVLAVLPALVLGLVTLFYNSAGGMLIFLGNWNGLLPHGSTMVEGRSSLPVFQQLDTNAGAVVLRSVAATTLCFVATAVMVAAKQARNDRSWLVAGSCCLLASIAGGRLVALAIIPAFAISVGYWIRHQMHRRG